MMKFVVPIVSLVFALNSFAEEGKANTEAKSASTQVTQKVNEMKKTTHKKSTKQIINKADPLKLQKSK